MMINARMSSVSVWYQEAAMSPKLDIFFIAMDPPAAMNRLKIRNM